MESMNIAREVQLTRIKQDKLVPENNSCWLFVVKFPITPVSDVGVCLV